MATKLRVLTYNVFFDPVCMEARMRAIGRIIARVRPALIGFQEVTRDSLALLKKQQWTRYYDCSVDTAPPFSEAYFVVLFSALPVLALETLPFANTGMGRELVTMQVEVAPEQSLFVGTSHLESMPQFARSRVSQLKESMQFLQDRVDRHNSSSSKKTKCLGAIFMGDTNLMRSDMKLLDPKVGAAVSDLEVERAKSARSKCRKCAESIAKDAVRVGKMVKETVPGGRQLEVRWWYHEDCFLKDATDVEKQFVQNSSVTVKDGATTTATADATTTSQTMDRSALGLPPGWRDLWLSVAGNTEENGITFDGKTNSLVTSRAFQSRLDRMFFFPGESQRDAFASASILDSIELVGKEQISDGLWPSDHYGLLASFSFGETDKSQKEQQGAEGPNPAKKAKTGATKDSAVEID
uniref:PARP-type domain-containing protein n=1 Tax=Globisporangium ultimum (strain ATCC 200006 / CBS 805.95 / DAOM BR144) TaxID=431595 RepID=K3WLG2_GLOUD